LKWATDLDSSPLYEVNACIVRMLYHLWRGETRDAAQCSRRADILRVQNNPYQYMDGSYLPIELGAHVAAGSLMQVKRVIQDLEPLAKRYRGWQPMLQYARGEYHRLRGDYSSALSDLEGSLSAGHHQAWADAAGAQIATLIELAEYARATTLGRGYLERALDHGIDGALHVIRIPLALACASFGDLTGAVLHADAAVSELTALGATGLCLINAYAARARIARASADAASFERYATLCAEQLGESVDRRIVARYADLVDGKGVLASASNTASSRSMVSAERTASATLSAAATIHDFRDRTELRLQVLVRNSGSEAGYLFSVGECGAVLVARVGEDALPDDIDAQARAYLIEAFAGDDCVTQSGDALDAPPAWLDGHGHAYRAVLLQSPRAAGLTVTGLAVLAAPRDDTFEYPGKLALEMSRFACESTTTRD
jgi:hypothetical protein